MAESERLGASFNIDISSLKSGLQQANRLIRESNSEFKAAAAGMGDWSKSEEGLTAKIKNLNKVAELQAKKVSALQAEYDKCIEDGLDPMSAAAVKMRTDINNEKAALAKTQSEIQKYTKSLDELGNTTDEAGEEMEDLTDSAKDASDGFTVMKGALADLVADGFRKAISAAKEFASGMIETAANVKAANSQFEQAFGDLEGEATSAIKNIANSTGILDTRLQSTGAGIYSFARSSGATTAEAMELMQEALVATADSAAYYDRSLEDSAETLQSFLKGNFANDAALGVSATEFTRNAKATELFGKKYNDLSEIEKQKTLLKMVTDSQQLSGAMGQAARESDGFENVMGNVTEAYKQFQAKVGTPVLEALIPVIQESTTKFQKFEKSIDWRAFNKKATTTLKNIISTGKTIAKNVFPALKVGLNVVGKAVKFVAENFTTLSTVTLTAVTVFKAFKAAMAVSAAITAAKTAISGLSAGVGIATKAQVVWNAAMSANPIGAIITAVALLAGGIALLVSAQQKATEAQTYLNEEQENAVAAATEAAEAYRDTKEAADELAASEIANVDYVENNLLPQLKDIVDSNGEVKKGYEERANFILGELNEALGTEYESLSDIVDVNGQIKDSIYETIKAKKAQILLESYEDSYREAVSKVAEAEKRRSTQAQALAKAEEAAAKAKADAESYYQEQVDKGYAQTKILADGRYNSLLKEQEATQQALESVSKEYDQSAQDLYTYYKDISDYETASTLVMKGETQKAIGYLDNLGSGFKTAASTAGMSAEDQKKVLEQQVIDTQVNAELMKSAYEDGVEGVTEEMVKTAHEQAEQAKEEFFNVGGNITKGIADGAEGEEETNWTLSGAMTRLINKALSAARKAADEHSPSKLFEKKVGIGLPQGVAVGVSKGTKYVVNSVKKQVKDIKDAYDLSGISSSVDVGINSKATAKKASANEAEAKASGGVTVNQTNYYSQAHSRYEIYKSKQQTAAAVRLALQGV